MAHLLEGHWHLLTPGGRVMVHIDRMGEGTTAFPSLLGRLPCRLSPLVQMGGDSGGHGCAKDTVSYMGRTNREVHEACRGLKDYFFMMLLY